MPVWHKATEDLRKSGKLVVIGLTQEQHPDRCRLFAQWHDIRWPILWDPFNITDSYAVPRATLIDEHGVVRALRFDPDTVEASFLDKSWPPVQDGEAPFQGPAPKQLAQLEDHKPGTPEQAYFEALSALLWQGPVHNAAAIMTLQAYAKERPRDAAAVWRLGVAERMRHDSTVREPADFQNALTHWARGLALNPRQYIYRRRIQQYGPRLDKPYPFYPWIAEARKAIQARGVDPLPLRVGLSGSELAGRELGDVAFKIDEPDPKAQVPTREGLVSVESSVAWHTSPRSGDAARVHVRLRPTEPGALTWDREAGPARIWIQLPKGWKTDTPNVQERMTEGAAPGGEPSFDFELRIPAGSSPSGAIRGYALFHACLQGSGECTYLRQDLLIDVKR